jgi:transketolase
MGAAAVGMAMHGGILPITGTFFVFLDYMRPPVRLASLSRAKVLFVFSHDSVGVGEDGPTHQPVEHLATLRAIPGLQVIRPADGNETAAAFRAAVDHDDGPTVIVLSRQGIPTRTDGSAVERGAGIVADVADPALVIVATGSEVWVAMDAAERLTVDGVATRVVSPPSWDRFAAQGREYRDEMLPPGVPVLSVEAGTTFGWAQFADDSVGIDRFGVSAPGDEVLTRLGINVDNVVQRAKALVG